MVHILTNIYKTHSFINAHLKNNISANMRYNKHEMSFQLFLMRP